MKKITLIISCLFIINSLSAQRVKNNSQSGFITCSEFHITRPLREIFAGNPVDETKIYKGEESEDREHNIPQRFKKTVEKDGPAYGNDHSTIQTAMGTTPGRSPIENWAGQTATGFYPLDPSGAAGPNNYVQMINATTFRVWNKTGTLQLTGTFGNLWTTATPNDGDPIVLYDKAADRWFMSQFGQTGNKIYIAVSTSSDPTGSWYTYTFTSPQFPDYLKFSVWQDGYYMCSNQSTQKVFAFERTQMLLGNAASRVVYQTFNPPHIGSSFFVPLPGDTGDGTLAPTGTPCPIFSYSDNGWGGSYVDAVNISEATVNWVPATPTMAISTNVSVPTAAFDGSYNSSWDDVSQPGTTQKLDGIGGTLMFRAQYKIWGGYNSVVLNWAVKISATQRSIKWCELRQTGGVWAIYQEGIYTPDADTRWMGSIAMDNNGAIALCYMKSNASSIYPSLYYTGRRSCDPIGTLPITETLAKAGAGSQGNNINRDGDYSETWLDPDGITFWHTGMYMDAGGNQQTQIYSFQIPTCSTNAGIVITQTAGTNPECAGASATFTATPTNGGTTPAYQWKVNGVNAGTNSATFTTTTLTTGQIVTCVMTSNLVGVTGNPATSNAITMVVNPVLVPSLSIALTTGTNPECTGASATFTATPANGGTTPAYQWKVNGVNSGTNSATFTTTTLTTGQIVTCVMTSNALCASPTTCISNAITMVVNATVVPAVSIALTTGTNPECAGASATFTATPTNGGVPTYQWKVNGVNSGTGVTFTTTTLTTGQIITCVMTSTAACANPATATSNAITMTVTASVVPAVSVALTSGTNPECAGASATFTATPTNGGTTPTYQWKVNGVNVGTGLTFTTTTLTNGQIVTCVMTSNANCASPTTGTSNAVTMVVNSNVAPTVSIALTTGTNPECAGASATFTATPTNGGTTPTYQWKVNGVNAATGVTFTTTTLTTGQIVTCVMTSNSPCVSTSTANSNAITMTVTATVVPSVVIALTTGTNPECAGVSTTFTATPTNGGVPAYQWQVNGVNAGTNSATFTTTTLTTGQIVTCIMTSTAVCPNPATATSNAITMTINPTAVPSVLITQTSGTNPECAGASATFTATPTNGGTTPTYQWKVNGVNAATGVSFTTTTLTNGQIVTCVMTSNVACASANTATSNAITMVITPGSTPSVSIALTSGTNPECAGISTTFTATAINGGSTPAYQWFVDGLNSGSGLTYTTTALTTGQIVTCIMTSNAICSTAPTATSNAITMTINVAPAAPTALSNSPICAGGTINLSTVTLAGATYSWTGPNSYTSSSQNPTLSATMINAGTYSLTETVSGCSSPAGTVVIQIDALPVITNTTLTQTVCSGDNDSFNPTASIVGTTYTWTASSPGNITGYSPNGTGSIGDVLTNTSSTPSTVSYVITPAGPVPSSCQGGSVTFVVTVNPLPTVTVDSATICSGQTTTLTASGATTYTWSAGTTSTGISTVTVNPLTTATFTVTGTTNGCFSTATSTITVTQLPVVGVNSPTICIGQAATLTASGANTYTWSTGATSTGINTATASPINTTTYTVTGTSAGCTNTAFSLVTVDALPATPVITQNGAVLSSSSAIGNQWYLNGVLIAGATNQFYTTTQNGVYTVIASEGGCTSLSSAGTDINTGIAELLTDFSFDIYPNPNDGTFVLNINSSSTTTYVIEIHNTLGQLIYKQSLKQFTGMNSYPVDISEYSKGIYMISLIDGHNQNVKKIIVY